MADAATVHRLGLDIGGANIKLFHTCGVAESILFPMWIRPRELSAVLVERMHRLPACQAWGVTMTGELADGFANRREGVRVIVEQTVAAATQGKVRDVGFYATPGCLVSAEQAMAKHDSVASANWHALAKWIAGWIDRPSLLIDIGSTTADLIPLVPGHVDTTSRTDYDRLVNGELVYMGGSRTPVCSLVDSLPFRGQSVPVMREVFANTDDCALVLRLVSEDAMDCQTCDQRPRTQCNAMSRLARMIGLDGEDVTLRDAEQMAQHVFASAERVLQAATQRHQPHAKSQWILSGHSPHLLRPTTGVPVIDLANKCEPAISRVGPAYAICEMMRCGTLATARH